MSHLGISYSLTWHRKVTGRKHWVRNAWRASNPVLWLAIASIYPRSNCRATIEISIDSGCDKVFLWDSKYWNCRLLTSRKEASWSSFSGASGGVKKGTPLIYLNLFFNSSIKSIVILLVQKAALQCEFKFFIIWLCQGTSFIYGGDRRSAINNTRQSSFVIHRYQWWPYGYILRGANYF